MTYKTVLLAVAAVVALSSAEVAFAAETLPVTTSAGAGLWALQVPNKGKMPSKKGGVLYTQMGTDSGVAVVSQDFEANLVADDSQAADDFAVPAGTAWDLTEVDVKGVYFNGNGPAESENVYIYADNNGTPAKTALVEFDNVIGADNAGSFAIVLPNKVELKATKKDPSGKYWVSVQANLTFANGGGEWGWENQTTQVGNPAMWENPINGFNTGCIAYKQENVCIPRGQGDHMFTLKGASKKL